MRTQSPENTRRGFLSLDQAFFLAGSVFFFPAMVYLLYLYIMFPNEPHFAPYLLTPSLMVFGGGAFGAGVAYRVSKGDHRLYRIGLVLLGANLALIVHLGIMVGLSDPLGIVWIVGPNGVVLSVATVLLIEFWIYFISVRGSP